MRLTVFFKRLKGNIQALRRSKFAKLSKGWAHPQALRRSKFAKLSKGWAYPQALRRSKFAKLSKGWAHPQIPKRREGLNLQNFPTVEPIPKRWEGLNLQNFPRVESIPGHSVEWLTGLAPRKTVNIFKSLFHTLPCSKVNVGNDCLIYVSRWNRSTVFLNL